MTLTTIAPLLTVHGNLTYGGDMLIEGRVFGDIIPADEGRDISVAEGALVQSNQIAARNMDISGRIESKVIRVAQTITIRKSAHVVGAAIYFHTLNLEQGAVLENCKLEHKPWPQCGRDGNRGGIINI